MGYSVTPDQLDELVREYDGVSAALLWVQGYPPASDEHRFVLARCEHAIRCIVAAVVVDALPEAAPLYPDAVFDVVEPDEDQADPARLMLARREDVDAADAWLRARLAVVARWDD